MGSVNVSQAHLSNVKEVFSRHEGQESKGIKVHFRLDESGVLRLDRVDVTFEKSAKELEAEQSTLSSKTLRTLGVFYLIYMFVRQKYLSFILKCNSRFN
jgi:hypoxia up-regulated 1